MSLEQEKKSLIIRLNRLLGRSQVDIIETGSIDLNPLNPEAIVDTNTMDNLPDLEWYDQEVQISEAIQQRTNTEGLPTIGLGLDYIMVGKRTDADPRHNGRDIVMPMLSVKVPLYRQKYKAVEQREKSRQIAISLRKEDKRLEILKNIREAQVLIDKEQNNLEFYDDQVQILDRTIDILLTEYSTKGNQFDELLKLQNQRIDFSLKQLQAKVNIYIARLVIERWQP